VWDLTCNLRNTLPVTAPPTEAIAKVTPIATSWARAWADEFPVSSLGTKSSIYLITLGE
jgi:hypothetical protein